MPQPWSWQGESSLKCPNSATSLDSGGALSKLCWDDGAIILQGLVVNILHGCRCMMHGFGLVMGSMLAHPWAKKLVVAAQKLVTFFRASSRPMALLRQEAALQGIFTTLSSSNKTRMTSVQICINSVLVLKDPIKSLRRKHSSILPPWLIQLIDDDERSSSVSSMMG